MKKAKRLAALLLSAALFATTGLSGMASGLTESSAEEEAADEIAGVVPESGGSAGTYTMELDTAEHGYLYFTGTDGTEMEAQYSEGDTVEITAVPAEGYTLATVSLLDTDGVFIQQDEDIAGTYDEETREVEISFPMPAEDALLSVTFALIPEEFTEEFLAEFEAGTEALVENLEAESGGESTGTAASVDGVSLEETKSLSLATYSVSRLASGTTYFTTGTNHRYNNYSTYEGRATWNGSSYVTFCLEPSKKTPTAGTYTATEWESSLARAVCYYGYGGGGYNDASYGMLLTLIGAGSENEQFAYVYTHLALAWVYDGCSESSDAFKGVESGTTAAVKVWVNRIKNAGVTAPTGLHVYTFCTGSSTYQSECFWYQEPAGNAYVRKTSSNTSLTDGNSSYSLAGAQFAVYNSSNALVAILTTGSDGVSQTVSLSPGSYWLYETSAPTGYAYEGSRHYFTVTTGQTTEVSVSDTPNSGSVVIHKSSANSSLTSGNSNYSLAGAVYGLYNSSGTQVAALTTDADGYAAVSGLAIGSYTVKEISAPTGYNISTDSQGITVTSGQTVDVYTSDEPKTVTVSLTKQSSNTDSYNHSEYSLKGVVYGVYRDSACTSLAGKITTDKNGAGSLSGLALGTYYIKEISPAPGYELDTATYTADAKTSSPSVTVKEKPKTGSVELYKTSSKTSLTGGNSNYTYLGATYTAYSDAACTKKAGWTITTDASGYGKAEDILFDTYYLKETAASSGYDPDGTVYEVTLSEAEPDASREVSVDSQEDPILITVSLTKETDLSAVAITATSESVKENIFQSYAQGYSLKGAVYGVYADAACTKMVDTVTTDENGQGSTTAELAMGTYYVKEVTPPEGYELNDTVYTVTADNTVISSTNRAVSQTVEDKPETGRVVVYKQSSDPSITDAYPEYYSMDGAEYTVYYSETLSEASIAGVITIKDGKGELDGVLYGDVWVKETKAPQKKIDGVMTDMYSLDETVYHCTVSSDTPEVMVTSTDKPVPRTIYIYKGPLAMLENGTSFTAHIPDSATKVVFTSSRTIPSTATRSNHLTDVSFAQNGGVMAWLEGTTWYVQSVSGGSIYFNYDSSCMFKEDGYEQDKASRTTHTLQGIDFGSGVINTSYATNMGQMFRDCFALTSITGLDEFDTSSVTSMGMMFFDCASLTAIDISSFDTSNVTGMSQMFAHCRDLENITTGSGFDTSRAENFQAFLAYTNLSNDKYQELVNKISIDSATNLYEFFRQGTSGSTGYASDYTLTDIDLSSWDFSGVTNMARMFLYCENLQRVRGLEIPSTAANIYTMFAYCYDLGTQATTITFNAGTALVSYDEMFKQASTNVTRTNGVKLSCSDTAGVAAAKKCVATANGTNTAGTAVRNNIIVVWYNNAVQTASLDTAGSSVLAASISPRLSDIASMVKGAFTAAAGKAGLVTQALAAEVERSLTNAVYCAYTDAACSRLFGSFTYQETITDTNGEQVAIYALSNVPYGQELWVKEEKASTGYLVDESTYYYAASAADGTYCNSTEIPYVPPEEPYDAVIKLYKSSADTNVTYNNSNYSYERAVFTLYGNSDCDNALYTMTTDANGYAELTFKDLAADEVLTFYIVETTTPAGYKQDPNFTVDNPYKVVLSADNPTEAVFADEEPPKTGGIKVYKRSSNSAVTPSKNTNYSYEGAVFGVYTDAGCTDASLYTLLTTNSSGYAAVSGVPLGDYWVKELVAPEGYILDSTIYPVTISEVSTSVGGSVKTMYIYDAPDTGTVTISKYADDASLLSNAAYSLAGAEFAIYTDSSCQTVAETLDGTQALLVTDADGNASISGLAFGTYYVKETKASAGFTVNSSTFTVTLSASKTSYTVPVEEGSVTGSVKVKKVSQDTGLTDGNSSYTYENAVFGIYTSEDCSSSSRVASISTDSNGEASCTGLPLGTYYIREDAAPHGYEVNSTVFRAEITLNAAGTGAQTTYYSGGSQLSATLLTVEETPQYVSIDLYKYSSDGSVTDGNTEYSLEGAKFGVYTDEGCKTAYKVDGTAVVLTTDADGHASVSGLPLGTYYVKETAASTGYKVNSDTFTVYASSSAGTYTVMVPEEPVPVPPSIVKVSADTSLTAGNQYYSLAGALFGIFTDEACTDCVETITTQDDGTGEGEPLPAGTYYIKELAAPEGYQVNSTVFKAVLSADGTASYTKAEDGSAASSGGSLKVADTPETTGLQVYKDSADKDLTSALGTYSLEGAVYDVYASEADAQAAKNSLGSLTTDEYGQSDVLDGLAYGTYYIKETQAPDGFEPDETVYAVTVSSGEESVDSADAEVYRDVAAAAVVLCVSDDAAYEASTIRIMKESAQDPAPGPLDGAQFVIQYYDGYYTTQDEIQAASPATRYWVIETKEVNGEYIAELTGEYLLDGSDSLFYDENGSVVLPAGTYTMYETLAPDLYSEEGSWLDSDGNELARLDEDNTILFQVKQDADGRAYIEATAKDPSTEKEFTVTPEAQNGVITFTKEDMALGSITLIKQDESGSALKGVTYELSCYNERTGAYEKVMSATTDDTGTVLFDELVYGDYRITETSTIDGLSLLAESINVTIPYTISIAKAEALGADMDKAVLSRDGKTCYFVDLTYTITDSEIFGLPSAGADPVLPAVLFAGLGMAAVGLVMMFRRKKTRNVTL